jgi:two-component system sensor histidine kinase KdpD
MGPDPRPDPDRLLAAVTAASEQARRGRLRIFFGASAGVGKTYAMLEAARAARAGGTDLVVGYVEPHGRRETERLLEGLEHLPTLAVKHHAIILREFDLDAALRRRPAVLLVDELAHSNPTAGEPRPRHAKRWQDIEELLDAGISVWTTVNVQHLEGLSDVVAGITGVRQQETVPDSVFESADEVELIDLPAEDLLARLRAGKVYVPEQAGRALNHFFLPANLTALRELALRKTADRVDASVRALRDAGGQTRPWLARERLIIAPGPDAQAEQLVRAGKRLADGLDAEWTVVYVETPRLLKLSAAARDRRIAVLRLAESMGAETVTLDGPTAAATLVEYARTRNANRIVVGYPKRHGWRALLQPSTVTELVRRAGTMDVLIVGSQPGEQGARPRPSGARADSDAHAGKPINWPRYAWALGTTLICTVLAWQMYPWLELSNLVMVYLLGAAIAGLRLGRGPAILTSILNVAAFDFFFVPPRFTFAVSDAQYVVTFGVMLVIALVLANLMVSIRLQTRIAGHRERRTAALYAMSRELAQTRGAANMVQLATRHVEEVFASQAQVMLPGIEGHLQPPATGGSEGWVADTSVAEWVFHHATAAGLGTNTLAGTGAIYLPLVGTARTQGVLAVRPANVRRILLPEQLHLLETFAGQLALALERAVLAEHAEAARVAAETEGLRSSLLSSISHDLRTPLAVIAGASGTLAENPQLDEPTRLELIRSIQTHADDMAQLISNVLDLMRLESGAVQPRLDDYDLAELVGSVLRRVERQLQHHPVQIQLPADLPAVKVDGVLISQLLANLLDNAARYTPEGTTITLMAERAGDRVRVRVCDTGPGLPPGDPGRLFDKFQRGQRESPVTGVGLGLAICRAIMQVHGGRISAVNGRHGGAQFEFDLPLAPGADAPPSEPPAT